MSEKECENYSFDFLKIKLTCKNKINFKKTQKLKNTSFSNIKQK